MPLLGSTWSQILFYAGFLAVPITTTVGMSLAGAIAIHEAFGWEPDTSSWRWKISALLPQIAFLAAWNARPVWLVIAIAAFLSLANNVVGWSMYLLLNDREVSAPTGAGRTCELGDPAAGHAAERDRGHLHLQPDGVVVMGGIHGLLERRIGPWSGRVWGLIVNLVANAVALAGIASVMRTGGGWVWIVVGGAATVVCVAVLALPARSGEPGE